MIQAGIECCWLRLSISSSARVLTWGVASYLMLRWGRFLWMPCKTDLNSDWAWTRGQSFIKFVNLTSTVPNVKANTAFGIISFDVINDLTDERNIITHLHTHLDSSIALNSNDFCVLWVSHTWQFWIRSKPVQRYSYKQYLYNNYRAQSQLYKSNNWEQHRINQYAKLIHYFE